MFFANLLVLTRTLWLISYDQFNVSCNEYQYWYLLYVWMFSLIAKHPNGAKFVWLLLPFISSLLSSLPSEACRDVDDVRHLSCLISYTLETSRDCHDFCKLTSYLSFPYLFDICYRSCRSLICVIFAYPAPTLVNEVSGDIVRRFNDEMHVHSCTSADNTCCRYILNVTLNVVDVILLWHSWLVAGLLDRFVFDAIVLAWDAICKLSTYDVMHY